MSSAPDAAARRALMYVGRLAHPLYREQMHAAPAGWEYVAGHPDLHDEQSLKRDLAARGTAAEWLRTRLLRTAVQATTRAGWLRRRRVDVPPGTQLVHSGQVLLRDAGVPYVVDCEVGHVFTFYQRGGLERPWARRALVEHVTGGDCRAILPWTEAARRGLLAALGPSRPAGFDERVRTVLPAIRPRARQPRNATGRGPLRALFVGSTFLGKGGAESVAAVRALRATHDVELDVVTALAPGMESGDGVRFHDTLPPPAIRELYASCDVFLFPAHVDTLGWVVFEALAEGMPVLATDHFALPELVEHDVSGLVVAAENSLYDEHFLPRWKWWQPTRYPQSFLDALAAPSPAYVDRVAAALARLAEDRGLVERLSAGALERVTDGPLSMPRRREALARVYAEAA